MWFFWTVFSILTAAAGVASYTDWTRREIPNWLTGGLVLAGLVLWTIQGALSGGWQSALVSLAHSAGGMFIGFTVFLIFYLVGAMEMGDVKYMAAVGAMVGWPWVVGALIYTAVAGAVEAILITALQGTLARTLKNLWRMTVSWLVPGRERITAGDVQTTTVPYGIAIAVGSLWTLLALRFGILSLI